MATVVERKQQIVLALIVLVISLCGIVLGESYDIIQTISVIILILSSVFVGVETIFILEKLIRNHDQ